MVGGSKASNLRYALFHKGYKRSSSFDFTFSLFFLSFSLSNSVRSLRLVRLRDKGHSRSSLTAKENVTFPFFFAQMYKISLYLHSSFVYIYDFFNVQSFVLVNFYRLFGSIHFSLSKSRSKWKHTNKRSFKPFPLLFSRKKKIETFLLKKKNVSLVDQTIDKLKTDASHFTRNGFEGDEFGFHRLLVTGHRNQMTQSNSDCISRHYLALINTYVLPLPLSCPPR